MYATAAPTAPAMPSLYMTPQGAPPQPALPSYGSAFGPSPLMAATYGAPTNGIGAATPMSFRPAASFGATALYGPTGFDASAVLDPSAERIRQLTAQVAFLENKGNELTRQLNESYDLVRPHGEAARCRHGWRVVCVCVCGENAAARAGSGTTQAHASVAPSGRPTRAGVATATRSTVRRATTTTRPCDCKWMSASSPDCRTCWSR